MKLSMLLPPKYDEMKWSLAAQLGVKTVITKAAPELSGRSAPYDKEALGAIKEQFFQAGFSLYGLEGDQFDMSRIKLGLPGRDEDIEHYQRMIKNMGELEIPLLCYNFMASIGWFRTRIDIPERGGALTSEFRRTDMDPELLPPEMRVSEEKLRENILYFLKAVIPTAEEAGVKMALHPDDPPLSPLRGVSRILTSAAAIRELMQAVPSPINGVAFCQATFRIMGEDIEALAREWLDEEKLFFVHLRDVSGTKEAFRETFHDNGPTDMVRMLKVYHEGGFTGPLRPDHAPAMYGEGQAEKFSGGLSAGYEMMGKIFAAGYIKGICETAGIELE